MQSMAKRMAEQMELFEPVERGFDEGGLMDEGGTVDPVSGNEVPPGSTQEEVRDDIPAQLSEGEFVFPADVVRYIGLENLMRMRQEAKQGLAQMEAMGQMGNSEEATVQDDLPFDMYDLDVEDEGTLNMQAGGMVPIYNPQTGTYSMPGTGIGGFQPAQQPSNTGFTAYTGPQPYMQPLQYTGTQFTTAGQTTNIPTFGQMVGSGYQGSELRTYVNDAGQTIQIPFVDGKPVYPIPDGYNPVGDQPKQEQPVTQLSGPTTTVTDQMGGRDDMNITDVPTSTTTKSTTSLKEGTFPDSYESFLEAGLNPSNEFGGSKYTMDSSTYAKNVGRLGGTQISSLSPLAAGASAISGRLGFDEMSNKLDFNNRAIAGNDARNTALGALGMIDPNQMYSKEQADFVGSAMDVAMEAQLAGKNVSEAVADFMRQPAQIELATDVVKQVASSYVRSKGLTQATDSLDIESLAVTVDRLGRQDIDNINEELQSTFGSQQQGVKDFSIEKTENYEKLGKTEAGKKIQGMYNSYRSRRPGTDTFVHDLTPAARRQVEALNKKKAQINALMGSTYRLNTGVIDQTTAAKKAKADKIRADAIAAKAEIDAYVERSTGRDEDFGGFDDVSPTGDAEDEGDFAIKSGGLVQQMKQSGLASKK